MTTKFGKEKIQFPIFEYAFVSKFFMCICKIIVIIRVSVVLRRTVWGDIDRRTNHFLQSSQLITSWLTDKQPITSWLHGPIRSTTRDIYTIYWCSTIYLTLKMTSAQVVEKPQSMSPQTVLLRTTLTWVIIINLCIDDMTPGFKPFTVKFFYKFHMKNNMNQFSFFSHSFCWVWLASFSCLLLWVCRLQVYKQVFIF